MPSASAVQVHVLRVVPMKDRIYRNLPAFHAQPAAWAKGSYRAVLLAEAIQSVKHARRMPSASAVKVPALPAVPMKDQIYRNLPVFRVQPAAWAKVSYRAALSVEATQPAKLATRILPASAAKVHASLVATMRGRTNQGLPVFRAQHVELEKGTFLRVEMAWKRVARLVSTENTVKVALMSARRVHPTLFQTRPSRPASRVPNVELEKGTFLRVEMVWTRVAQLVLTENTVKAALMSASGVHPTLFQTRPSRPVFRVNRVLLERVFTQLARMAWTLRV